MTRLVVVGLGLIGGSIALAHRESEPDAELVGIDRADVIALPGAAAAVEQRIDAADGDAVRVALSGASLVVLAMPVREIARQVADVLELADVVTDCGSTKRLIVEAASRSPRASRFVPGHPMAGAPEGGVQRARADLFQGRRWLLCPEASDPDAVARVEELVRRIGAAPAHLAAFEHDRAVALMSHVPQLLASAMVVLAERGHAAVAAGPAFARLTRGAGGPPSMWGDVFSSNADEVAGQLRALCRELERIATQLEQAQAEGALALLAEARATLDSAG